MVTIQAGLSNAVGSAVDFVKGVDTDDDKLDGIPAAVAACQQADVVVLAIGDSISSCGEWRDRATLDLPGGQLALMQNITAACGDKKASEIQTAAYTELGNGLMLCMLADYRRARQRPPYYLWLLEPSLGRGQCFARCRPAWRRGRERNGRPHLWQGETCNSRVEQTSSCHGVWGRWFRLASWLHPGHALLAM